MSTQPAKGNKAAPRGHENGSASRAKTVTVSLRMPAPLREKVVDIARRERRSLNSQALMLMEAGLGKSA